MNWDALGKKLKQKIDNPRYVGFFASDKKVPEEMRIVTGEVGSITKGLAITFYLLVDETDGVIADINYQIFGPPAFIGAAEACCELVLRKNYQQVSRISAELIDKQVRDNSLQEAFPEENYPHLNMVILAIDDAIQKCTDIPCEKVYEQTPISYEEEEEYELPNWETITKANKISFIEKVIEKEVRPYIELDEGGVEIVDLEDYTLHISYQGACTSCFAATGSTLSAIQQILRKKVHPKMIVVPNL